MDKELKDKWIEALVSGKYQQSQGILRETMYSLDKKKSYSYCCLGVLADIADDTGWLGGSWFDQYNSFAPETLQELGLTINQQEKLIDMNDSDGASFKVIASYIKTNL